MAHLIFRNGPYKSKSLRIPDGKNITMGRNRDIELPLPDLKLSRRHCVIEYHNGSFVLRDLGSTNGTYVNGKRVTGTSPLHNYDRILLGDTEIEFQCPEEFEHDATQVAVPNQDRLEESARAPLIPFFNENSDSRTKSNNPPVNVPHGHDGAEVVSAAPKLEPLAEALKEIDRPLPPEPNDPAKMLPRLLFCDLCNVSIPVKDFDSGRAKETEGRLVCGECLSKSVAKPGAPKQKIEDILAQLDEVEEIVIDDDLPELKPSPKIQQGRGEKARAGMVRRGSHPAESILTKESQEAAITEFLEDDELEELDELPPPKNKRTLTKDSHYDPDGAPTEIGELDN